MARTGSTNADMLALAGTTPEGDWLIADTQTSGRGRMGRNWVSPQGNFYGSTLVHLREGDPPAPTLALVAGIAVFDAIVDLISGSSIQLKWPNDVLSSKPPAEGVGVGLPKLAGILLERTNNVVVIGIGINLANHPDDFDRPATSLYALTGSASEPMAVAEQLAQIMAHWLVLWRTQNLDVIRTAWLARAHPLGTPLSAAVPDGTRINGHFDGLTPDCALRLRLADGTTRVIHAGDVFMI